MAPLPPGTPVLGADVVLVGSGAAGLSAALHATGARVALLTADAVGTGSASAAAMGGIAAAVAATDSPDAHAADTLAVGALANDPAVVDLLTTAAPATVTWLDTLGTRFARDGHGWVLGREAGHGHDRILQAGGDATGWEITRALAAAVMVAPHVTVHPRTRVVDLLVDGGRVVGVLARRPEARPCRQGPHRPDAPDHPTANAVERLTDGSPNGHTGELVAIGASAVVLATGGSAGAWRDTTNPPGSHGSGLVLAADAGADLVDLQYVQFHPTALDCGADPLPLLTEALRGAGAAVVDEHGRRFLDGVHPDAELAPRDVVARAIWRRRLAGERVLLDLRRVTDLELRFPTAVASCQAHGLDPLARPVPVTPAAHYHMGGIAVDHDGRSTLPGLYAAGEVACTGAHGANRLASNSLLEALVFGERVGHAVRKATAPTDARIARALAAVDPRTLTRPDPTAVATVRDVLTAHVGVLRTGDGLRTARDELRALAAPDGGGAVAAAARMVTEAALAHRERRGAHWRADGDEPLAAAPRIVVTAPDRSAPQVTTAAEHALAGAS
ncbi:MAG TPA: FAD-binding protein [Euzebyales bacterium]|nr:FAD-binding protein [Euzebyales bacterium]